MKSVAVAAVVSGLSLLSSAAGAATAEPQPLSQCLEKNVSPKDRAELARWMFLAMSAGPALKGIATVSPEQRDSHNRATAALFERLVLRDCRREYVAAAKLQGQGVVRDAFRAMGERVAEQLRSDPAAAKELERFADHLDEAKWIALAAEVSKD